VYSLSTRAAQAEEAGVASSWVVVREECFAIRARADDGGRGWGVRVYVCRVLVSDVPVCQKRSSFVLFEGSDDRDRISSIWAREAMACQEADLGREENCWLHGRQA
jgi:hypothetical protein